MGASRHSPRLRDSLVRRAGVSRMTVYEHFPAEGDMVTACASHWIEHPPRTTCYRHAALVGPLAAIMDATRLALLDRAVDLPTWRALCASTMRADRH
jgi:AcrR family transcriptional regulator